MDVKQRERLILMLLPAAMLLLVYSFFFFRPQQRAIREKQQALEAAKRSATTEEDLAAARLKLVSNQRKVSSVREQIDQREAAIGKVVTAFGKNVERFAVMERIDDLLLENEITLVSQSLVEQRQLSQRQKDLLRKIEQRSDGMRFEYRRLRLEGRYADVQAFLDELAGSNTLALPVSLEAEKSKDHERLSWNLVVVM